MSAHSLYLCSHTLLLYSPSSSPLFFFNATATTEIYTLSLHDALPIWQHTHDRRRDGRARHRQRASVAESRCRCRARPDRKSTRLNSSHSSISYAVFCLKKKKKKQNNKIINKNKNNKTH